MRHSLKVLHLVAILSLLVVACQPSSPGGQDTGGVAGGQEASGKGAVRVAIGVTNPLESQDPLDHSDTFLYPFWCQAVGCLFGWDPKTGEPTPDLVESWKVENPTTWIFNLRQNVKWSDGSPFTAADVVHSLQRVLDHPKGRQKYRMSTVASFEAVDDHTVRLITKEPNAELLDAAFVLGIPITSKAQADRGEQFDRFKPVSAGPYVLKEWVTGARAVVEKNPNYWGGPVKGPDELIFRYIKEDEARMTALLNNEIQIAFQVPPQDAERIDGQPNVKVVEGDSLTIMFLAMQPKPPFDKKEVRQAVAYAIDRDAIIKGVLQGYAEKLEGPIGPGQYAYNPELQPRYTYNPEKAKQLLAQAGYPDGVDVELSTPVNFYVKDKEITEAIVPMLNAVGIRTKLLTPEWGTLWANVQEGKVPFYYMGRGQVRDPGQPLSQYFETGVSKRIGYSNEQLDALFEQERAAFDADERKKLLSDIMSMITEEAPGAFMWRHKLLWGMAENIEWTPRADEAVFGAEIQVK